jgi:peptidoglycan/LPS O-acetylase OafA/YrhL
LAYLLYVMITTFRKYLNKQGAIIMELNKNSYGVYIIHVIVMGSIALTMLDTAVPSLLKYFILTVLTFIVSNLIVSFYRKVVESILTGKCNYSGNLAMVVQQNNNVTT